MSISSEISRLGGNISDSLDAVSEMGGTVPSGATSDNLATAIRSIPQSGGGGTSLPSVTNDDNGKVLKVSSGAWGKGYQSWNDLTDRPFYETVTAAGYDYEIDTTGSYVTATYEMFGTTVEIKLYRAGNPLTAAQLVGASGTITTDTENDGEPVQDSSTVIVPQEYISNLENSGGTTVGRCVTGDPEESPFPLVVVVDEANASVDCEVLGSNFAATFTTAGTYFSSLDVSALIGVNLVITASELEKEAEATVTPLPDKYYKAPFNVTADLDLTNLSVSNVSKSFAEILAAIQGGRKTTLWLQFHNQNVDFNIPLYPSLVSELQIHFSVTAPYALTGNVNIYTIYVYINPNDSVYSNFYLHDATAQ